MSNLCHELPRGEIDCCEWCGDDKTIYLYSVTGKVVDKPGIRADIIGLCSICLRQVRQGRIPADKLFIRVAIREQARVEDIFMALAIPIPIKLKYLEEEKEDVMHFILAISTHIDYLLELNQKEKAVNFLRGDIIKKLMDDGGMKPADIARDIGQNKSFVVNHLKLKKAFPEAKPDDNDLLIEHYMIAAKTNNPEKWLMKAQQKNLSVGELKKVVKDSCVEYQSLKKNN